MPDQSMLITEKDGTIIHFKDGQKTEISGGPKVFNRNQGGLLDVRLHPDFKKNGWIYFTYSSTDGEGEGGNTALIRAQLKDNNLVNTETLYKAGPNTRRGHHFGSRIAFDTDNYVYFSNKAGAKTAIYSYGHRNPQGMAVHPKSGAIWVHEHGPRGGDEINAIQAGKNFGWPVISYGINYSGTSFTEITEKDGMEQPVYYWVPSIAPSGMAFGKGAKEKELNGNIFAGSLKFQYLERLILEDDKVIRREKLLENVGRVRNVVMGPDGYLYVGVEGKGILKLVKK